MGSPDAQELNTRAAQLRGLAADIEALPDKARTFATQTMTQWEGPHADRTRGEMGTWRTTCRTVAEHLRTEANTCEQNAKDLNKQR
ncbi:WXG100 family type VII secretion target [Streptomyces sp. NPDC021020]|uniref:WXG100 family type VII secretion target n=1 Tax=Streptomyces sp. NPDC021020 TaxID=3365109 RepID=UPI0037AC11FF